MASGFSHIIDLVQATMKEFQLLGHTNMVLITNGSRMMQGPVQAGIKKMAAVNGRVWFKIDRATVSGRAQINHNHSSNMTLLKRLTISSTLCPTWIQTCVFCDRWQGAGAA